MKEPPRQSDLNLLVGYFRQRVERVFAAMRAEGFDPIAFETRRSEERQEWLYGYGRTHHRGRKPITWTHESRHEVGKALDVVSKSRWWDWPDFYRSLKRHALREGLRDCSGRQQFSWEQCHIQWS